jgi:hypothetical protein
MKMFENIAKKTNEPLSVLKWSMHPTKVDSVYEWPTTELCKVICSILKFEQCNRMIELGAGTGLLSARLNHFLKDDAKVVATSPTYDLCFSPTMKIRSHHYTTNVFGPVIDMKCADFKEIGTPVLLAWMDDHGLDEFQQTVSRNKPDFFLCIGRTFPSSFYQEKRKAEMDAKQQEQGNDFLNYSMTVICPKMLCLHDRPSGPAGSNDSRSHLLWYRRNKPSLSDAEVIELCDKKNLGQCASLYDDAMRNAIFKSDYEFNMKHDPARRFSCSNPACPGCEYSM